MKSFVCLPCQCNNTRNNNSHQESKNRIFFHHKLHLKFIFSCCICHADDADRLWEWSALEGREFVLARVELFATCVLGPTVRTTSVRDWTQNGTQQNWFRVLTSSMINDDDATREIRLRCLYLRVCKSRSLNSHEKALDRKFKMDRSH